MSKIEPRIETVAVFCGAAGGNDPIYMDTAKETGALLARGGVRLLYGAGYYGIMGAVAKSALDHGGKVTGIITEYLAQFEQPQFTMDELISVKTMQDRKSVIVERADAFCLLPGGIGSLDELFEVLCLRQIKEINKPIVLLNVKGFWNPCKEMIKTIADAGFARKDHVNLLRMVDTPAEILPAIREEAEKANSIPGWPFAPE